jgi:hypothetical protein
MSFRLFIYYCAICGGWAAFVGWFAGLYLSPSNPLGSVGIRGMWLGMMVALGLGLVDSVWNLGGTHLLQIAMRTAVAVMVGCVAGLAGGVVGQKLYSVTGWELFYVFGWTLTGALVGISVGVFELLASLVMQKDFSGAVKKLVKALIGGTLGGLLGGMLSLALKLAFGLIFEDKEVNDLWSPTAWGFVALGMCIGLLIGLAQVILKEAWIRVERGRRAGREMILSHERTTIGRAESCDIGLFGDNQIEKHHASILLAGDRYYLEDEQTPVGTFVNGEPVQGRVALRSGDMIRLGSSVLCFQEKGVRGQGSGDRKKGQG